MGMSRTIFETKDGQYRIVEIEDTHASLEDLKGDAFEALSKQFTAEEASVFRIKSQWGTVAAQQGPGTEHKYLRFATEAAARKYVQLLSKRASAMGIMVGFILDRPINMMGETGWKQVQTMVFGRDKK